MMESAPPKASVWASSNPAVADDPSFGQNLPNDDPSTEKKDLATLASGGGGTIGAYSSAFGNKPNSFFTLLAAAAASNKPLLPGPEFYLYLKKSGVKGAWTRAVVALYEEPEKPDDPLEYMVRQMGLGIPEVPEVKKMQETVSRSRAKLQQLQAENFQLRQAIELAESVKKEIADAAKGSVVSLYDQSKYFSDYHSDDDLLEEDIRFHNYHSKFGQKRNPSHC